MTKAASDCASCGQADNLKSCSVCEQRLKQKGTANALCETCLSNEQSLNFFGIVIKKDDTTEYRCRPCVAFLERKEQEQIFQKLKGPDPEQILRTVTKKYPWALTIAKASPEEHLDALQFLKRKLSGHRTVHALAESLANNNAQAALLIQQLGKGLSEASQDDSMVTRVLRTFVKNQCPAIKYKSLLHPPGGSIYKATRHFQDTGNMGAPANHRTLAYSHQFTARSVFQCFTGPHHPCLQ